MKVKINRVLYFVDLLQGQQSSAGRSDQSLIRIAPGPVPQYMPIPPINAVPLTSGTSGSSFAVE